MDKFSEISCTPRLFFFSDLWNFSLVSAILFRDGKAGRAVRAGPRPAGKKRGAG